jgi:[ribosomal protein S5]-alanine N-acetyltransferase
MPLSSPVPADLFPLETLRVTLRRLTRADGAGVHAYMSDPDVTRWLPEGKLNAAAAQAYVDANTGEDARAFAALAKADERMIGHFLLHPWGDEKNRTFEIGWVLARAAQGQGLATEVSAKVLTLTFEKLGAHRVIATCQPQNTASARVAEKLGMRCEGRFRRCIYRGGDVWWDELFYAVLRDEHVGR